MDGVIVMDRKMEYHFRFQRMFDLQGLGFILLEMKLILLLD